MKTPLNTDQYKEFDMEVDYLNVKEVSAIKHDGVEYAIRTIIVICIGMLCGLVKMYLTINNL